MKKILFLIEQPFDERNYDRFGIQTWIDSGWRIEVWDLTPLHFPHYWLQFFEGGKKIKYFEGYYPISSKSQLEELCNNTLKVDYFVNFLGSNQSPWVIRYLHGVGGEMIECINNITPTSSDFHRNKRVHLFWRRLKVVISLGPVIAAKRLLRRFLGLMTHGKIQPSLVLVSGQMSIRSFPVIAGQRIIRTHSFDYDIYLKLVKFPKKYMNSYALFVDQDLAFHPEYGVSDIKSYVTPNQYFPILYKGLKRISSALETDIWIAEHPRAGNFQNDESVFNEFPVHRSSTLELISQAEFIVGHYSTALQMAVLFRRPLIFFTTNELRRSNVGELIEIMAARLGKTPINLDGDLNQVDWEKELIVDLEKYDSYRDDYIKCDGSQNLPSWNIVINYIEENTADTL